MESTQQQQQQTPVQLTLTLGQINAILQAMHKAPYEMAKPMIDEVTKQTQEYVSKANAAQQPQANQMPQSFQGVLPKA